MAPQADCPDENVKNWNKIVFMIALLPIILEALSLIGTLLVLCCFFLRNLEIQRQSSRCDRK
jgi:hypothetical protein